MQSKVFLLIFIAFTFTSFTSSEKDKVIEDLYNLSSYFVKNKDFKLKIDYSVYKGFDNSVAESKISGYFEKNDTLSKQSLDGVDTYSSSKFQISIDRKSKLIIINNGVADPYKMLGKEELKKNIESADVVEFIPETSTEDKGILFKFNNPFREYDKVEFFYNKKSFLINKIVFYTNDGSFMGEDWEGVNVRAEVNFTKITPSKLNVTDFKLETYVKLINNEFIGIGRYSDYKVIDLRIKK